MSNSTVVPVTDGNIVFNCTQGPGGWTLATDGSHADTTSNDCYMQYSFNATGISLSIAGDYNHGVYSCQLDDGSPQWFNANNPTPLWRTGCAISGLTNDKHTLKVTNAMNGWGFTLHYITVTTGDAFTGSKIFSSEWPSGPLPSTLASQGAASTVTATVTATSSSGSNVPVGTLAAVAAVLGSLFIGATIAAVYFWVRDSRFRRDHQWSQAISAAPIAYTTEPATSSRSMEQTPLIPSSQPSEANQSPDPPSYTATKAGSVSYFAR